MKKSQNIATVIVSSFKQGNFRGAYNFEIIKERIKIRLLLVSNLIAKSATLFK